MRNSKALNTGLARFELGASSPSDSVISYPFKALRFLRALPGE